jgi:hypothetical protein
LSEVKEHPHVETGLHQVSDLEQYKEDIHGNKAGATQGCYAVPCELRIYQGEGCSDWLHAWRVSKWEPVFSLPRKKGTNGE